LLQEYLYPPEPPVAWTTAVPSDSPLQEMSVLEINVNSKFSGSEIVTVATASQLFLSFTVTL